MCFPSRPLMWIAGWSTSEPRTPTRRIRRHLAIRPVSSRLMPHRGNSAGPSTRRLAREQPRQSTTSALVLRPISSLLRSKGILAILLVRDEKRGSYWALDRDTGEVIWEAIVSPSGFLGGMEGTSAIAAGVVAVPATDWPEFDGPATGLIVGLDAATGSLLWSMPRTAPAASPVGVGNNTVFHAGMDGILSAYNLSDGVELWSFDLGASASGGVAIANGIVVVGAATPQFAPFVRPGNTVQAFELN